MGLLSKAPPPTQRQDMLLLPSLSVLLCLFCQPTCLFAKPMLVENPFMTIAIDRTDLGSAYDMAVSRNGHSLALSGPPFLNLGFAGSSSAFQPYVPHRAPFTVFSTNRI